MSMLRQPARAISPRRRRTTACALAIVTVGTGSASAFSPCSVLVGRGRGLSQKSDNPAGLSAAPKGALTDIVIPSVFSGGILEGIDVCEGGAKEDPRVWVPQTDCLSFRPLCFCTSQGYYVNLLRFTGGGILGTHRHPSPVHALTLKGGWGYKEHDWHADAGTYVFEPPGETHTLVVDADCEEMVAMFHVTGALIYVDADSGNVTGYDDVFTKLEKAREWYRKCGLGEDYAEKFIR